ncbi:MULTISPECIES: autotransporter domain-containing protein [unclassified Bradyrhizobium]|uniref:autotransporter domain-containing protein n=1 Tax=unclassified Bradyrhizobium TaxID=2631580 RepID=UPI001FF99709|nr:MULTISPECIES: autotransporter domain-containing protein [unclassified Bradyrhizobium]MCK1712126.1 autotransporter domain-containing protein [Bradyrhizobium sp. 143]MCK1731301.1 autotransporter domain-containing protein [Bradyrhizobium sp. 142]
MERRKNDARRLARGTVSAAAISLAMMTGAVATAEAQQANNGLPPLITPPVSPFADTWVFTTRADWSAKTNAWATPSFIANSQLGAMNTQSAYARGFSGNGIALGQIDTGASFMDPGLLPGVIFTDTGLQKRAISLSGFSPWGAPVQGDVPYGGPPGFSGISGHGSLIAREIAGSRGQGASGGIDGVAFDSMLVVANHGLGTVVGFPDTASLTNYITQMAGLQARAINNSWTSPDLVDPVKFVNGTLVIDFAQQDAIKHQLKATDAFNPNSYNTLDPTLKPYVDTVNALGTAAAKDMVVVFAAGNVLAGYRPGLYPHVLAAAPYYRSDLESHWIAAVALDDSAADARLSAITTSCGLAKYWCVSAPGNFTSNAAADTTGAAALLAQRYPYLNGADLRTVLLTTATRLDPKTMDPNYVPLTGADTYGVNDIFGWGRINLDKAMDGPAVIGFMDTVTNQLIGGVFMADLPAGTLDVWRNSITGVGTLDKAGAGTLVLGATDGDGHPSAYAQAGGARIDGGTLEVNGTLTGPVVVGTEGRLTGTGSVGTTTVAGIVAPGQERYAGMSALYTTAPEIFTTERRAGTLTVNGDMAFRPGGVYQVLLGANSAHSQLNVTGNAALDNGALQVVLERGGQWTHFTQPVTVLSAGGGISGRFTDPTVNSLFLKVALDYSNSAPGAASSLTLSIQRNDVSFASVAGSRNGAAVATVLDAAPDGTGPRDFVMLASREVAAKAFDQFSGEAATGIQQATFNAAGQFMGVLLDPFLGNRAGNVGLGQAVGFAPEDNISPTNAYASADMPRSKLGRNAFAPAPTKTPPQIDPIASPWSSWVAGFGGTQTTNGNAPVGSNAATSNIYGLAAGADYRLSADTLLGFALGGGATSFSMANGVGSGRSDLFQAGAFVRHNFRAAYFAGALAYGWQDIATDRTVPVAGGDHLRARFNANVLSGRIEGGYRFATPCVGLTPYAAAQTTTAYLPAYAEQAIGGTGMAALSYAAKDAATSRTELGLRTDRTFAMHDAILTLRGRAAWAHDFDTDRAIAATFQTLPGASFVVNGAAPSHDAALTTASAELTLRNGISLAGTFEGEFSSVTRSYAGKGIVRYQW